ncbi:MAG: hypothetical protein ACYSUB_14705 [Planctomycetota bacterium]|jgi:Zn-dependent alcohol dehydrogenase
MKVFVINAIGNGYVNVENRSQTNGSNMVHFPCVFGHEPVGEAMVVGKAVKSRKSNIPGWFNMTACC